MENELPFRDWKRRTSKMDEQVNSGSKGASEKIYRILFEFYFSYANEVVFEGNKQIRSRGVMSGRNTLYRRDGLDLNFFL